MAIAAREAELEPGMMVMVGSREHGRPHTAKVIALRGDKVEVQPGGHKRTEVVGREHVKPWLKGETERQERQRQTRTPKAERRDVKPGDPNALTPRQLLDLTGRTSHHEAIIYHWIRDGLIPADAMFKPLRGKTRLFDKAKLEASGFFDHPTINRREGRPAGARPEVLQMPKPATEPTAEAPKPPPTTKEVLAIPPKPSPTVADARAKLAAIMRERAVAEALIFEAKAREVMALVEYQIAEMEAGGK